jgi:hypothetical protein
MNWHKRFTAFLILLLLLSSFVAVFHHHENTADDQGCPICLVIHHQQSTDPTTVAFDGVPSFLETPYVTSQPAIVEKIFTSFKSNRAPPA